MILGLSIGFALATAWWCITFVLLAFAYMMYLAPGCRRKALMVLASASAVGCVVWAVVYWFTGSFGSGIKAVLSQKATLGALGNLAFGLSGRTDGYVLVFLFIAALTAYGSWPRARYFGNTAPLLTSLIAVLLFSLVPGIRIWDATLGLSFVFIFVGGSGGGLPGNSISAANCTDFDCMFPATRRSSRDGPHELGAKLNVTQRP